MQQRHIAEMIGIHIIVDMLMLKSEKLQYIAGMAIIALSKENFQNQRLIARGGGIPPLVRLLRATTTPPKVRKLTYLVCVSFHSKTVGDLNWPNEPGKSRGEVYS